MSHECPRRGCDTEVGDDKFACHGDWRELPQVVRDAIHGTAKLHILDPARRAAITAARQEWEMFTLTDDPSTWVTSRPLAEYFAGHRDNDVKVSIGGTLVPIAGVSYHSVADAHVIELVDGEDLRVAMAPDLADDGSEQ